MRQERATVLMDLPLTAVALVGILPPHFPGKTKLRSSMPQGEPRQVCRRALEKGWDHEHHW